MLRTGIQSLSYTELWVNNLLLIPAFNELRCVNLNGPQRHRCVVVFECTTDGMRSAHTRLKELPHAHRLVQNTDDVYNYRRPPTDNSHPKHNQSTSPHCGGCELVSLDTRSEACEAIRPKCHHGNCGLMHYQTVIVLSSK